MLILILNPTLLSFHVLFFPFVWRVENDAVGIRSRVSIIMLTCTVNPSTLRMLAAPLLDDLL